MPPKRRQYRQPKTEKLVFFGPERPPPPEPPASTASTSTSSGLRQQIPTAQGGWDGTQGDAQPAQQDAPTAPASQEGEGEAMTAEIGGKGNKRRRKIPRKKWGKETKGGWDADDELPPHEQDEGRYDPSLPYDLRLLRCCDEFRSLRSFRDKDVRVNYNTLLRFFQADILTLRASYGSQILRGYDPEADQEDEDAAGEGDEDDGEGSDADEDPLQDKKVSLEGKTEEEWAGYVFDPGRLVKFFDNRFNDGYTPTLTLAPKIAGSFLKFQLARNVFPDYAEGIKACIAVCDTASKQLLPASILLKQLKNHDGLASSVSRLFRAPSPSESGDGANGQENNAAFSLPIPFKPDPALLASEEPADAVHSVYDISQKELTEIEALSEQVEPEPVKDWAEWKKREGGGGGRRGLGGATKEKDGATKIAEEKKEEEKEDESTAHLNRLKKQFELDASSRRKWTSRARSDAAAASQLAKSTKRLGLVGEGDEGAWMLGRRERSARTLEGWELVAGTPVPPEPRGGGGRQEKEKGREKEGEKAKKHSEGDDRLLVKLSFGKHEDAFPLTTYEHALPLSTVGAIEKADLSSVVENDLSSPLSVVVDLPPFFNLDHFSTLHHTLFEADLTQLIFVPSSPSTLDSTPSTSTSTTPTPLQSLWVFSSLHRIIPPYWTHTTELLREEPKEAERVDWVKKEGEEEEGEAEEGEGENVWMREMRERWRVEEEESAVAMAEGGLAPVEEEKQKDEEEGKEVKGVEEQEKPAARVNGARHAEGEEDIA